MSLIIAISGSVVKDPGTSAIRRCRTCSAGARVRWLHSMDAPMVSRCASIRRPTAESDAASRGLARRFRRGRTTRPDLRQDRVPAGARAALRSGAHHLEGVVVDSQGRVCRGKPFKRQLDRRAIARGGVVGVVGGQGQRQQAQDRLIGQPERFTASEQRRVAGRGRGRQGLCPRRGPAPSCPARTSSRCQGPTQAASARWIDPLGGGDKRRTKTTWSRTCRASVADDSPANQTPR